MFSNEITLDKLLPFFKDELSTLTGDTLSNYSVPYFQVIEREDILAVAINLKLEKELSLKIPGISGFEFVIDAYDEGNLPEFLIGFYPQIYLDISGIDLGIRFPTSLFKPVKKKSDGTFEAISSKSGKPVALEITVADVCFAIDSSGDIDFSLFDDSVPFKFNHPFMIGDSGVVVEVTKIELVQASNGAGSQIPGGGFGVLIPEATVHLPGKLIGPKDLKVESLAIGSGGFSGKIKSTWNGKKPTQIFDLGLGLKKVALEFKQNALIGSEIKAELTVPYFDKKLDVDIGFDLNGNVSISIDKDKKDGIGDLSIPNILTVKVDSLGFERKGEDYLIQIGGEIEPLIGKPALKWPKFKVKKLTIDSDGNVSIDGGWLDLPKQYSLDFHGFQVEITKIGFGTEDDGTKWIGFSGGIKLVEGLPVGASVEGLRISWKGKETSVSFNGIGVQFEVPGVLRFSGAVSYVEDKKEFKGDIKLKLISLNLTLDAVLLVGRKEKESPPYNYFFIFLETQLPVGVPLFSSGLALYGLAGLFANNMEPKKGADDEWYAWYTDNPLGVTDTDKWKDKRGTLAVGAGVTVGTAVDNGYAFSCRALLLVVIPGPIIILAGRAQILSERAELTAKDDPPLKALVVLDGRAGTFLFNIEATYRLPKSSGAVIDAYAAAEGYFAGADDWHFYLGEKDPREKRMRAYVIKLLEANAYFMLDPTKVQMGAYIGYTWGFFFGPVEAGLKAWIEGGAMISWKPSQFAGFLWLHGSLHLRVFGFGFSLSANAKIEVQTPRPYYVLIGLSVELDLPWFLPDIEIEIELKWEEDVQPPVALPLKEIAVGHLKVTDTWAMDKLKPPPIKVLPNKLPVYDTNNEGFWDGKKLTVDAKEDEYARKKSPVVPMDARPVLTFARPMNDLVGLGGAPKSPDSDTVGKKDFRYELISIKLEKWPKVGGTKWQTVALRAFAQKSIGELFGQWQATGAKGPVATKLSLWSKNSFDYLRAAGRTWADWFIGKNPGYPCHPAKTPVITCVNFDGLPVGSVFSMVFAHGGLTFVSDQTSKIVPYPSPVTITQHALLNLSQVAFRIAFPQPVASVTVYAGGGPVTVTAYHQGTQVGTPQTGIGKVTVQTKAIDWVDVISTRESLLLQICYVTLQALADGMGWKALNQWVQVSAERWYGKDAVFEPKTCYRLEVITRVKSAPKGTQAADTGKWSKAADPDFTEYGYFQTEGPPGLLKLPPRKQNGRTYAHPLTDLTPYVTPRGRTIPGDDQRARKGEPPRDVYRGYDVGVEFNENYVELMYRLAGRDLGLYIYDNNQQPVRDAQGRLVVLPNHWDKARQLKLPPLDNLWVYTVNSSPCAVIQTNKIQLSDTVSFGGPQLILRPQTLHDVRVIPLLLHDDFRSGNFTAWKQYNEGQHGGDPNWKVQTESIGGKTNHFLIQTSNHLGEGDHPADKPGTYLVRGKAGWTDFRLSVTLRSLDDDAIGVMFRYKDKDNYCRFSMDKQIAYRRLIKKEGGKVTVLAEDRVPFELKRDYQVTIEVIGNRIGVYLDGTLLFDVKDGALKLKAGKIGLYCWGNIGARFDDIRVDDFRAQTVPVYKFDLATSRYVDFAHHLHSFCDMVWDLELKSALTATQLSDLNARANAAKAKGVTYPPLETRQFYSLFGLGRRTASSALDVSLLRAGSQRYGLLLESPEPIRWKRVDIPKVQRADRLLPTAKSPGTIKLLDVALPPETHSKTHSVNFNPNKEYIDLMLRDNLNPNGHTVQHLRHPGSIEPVIKEVVLLTDDFDGGMSRWKVVDEGTFAGPSKWAATGGVLKQKSNICGEGKHEADKPGTYAIAGDATWTDYRVRLRLRSDDNDAIGVMFRYKDKDNYYRFSMDSQGKYRRLIKKVNGTVTVLWEDTESFETGRAYTITLDAFGNRLQGYLDGSRIFEVLDSDLTAGKIGLYCWGNVGANFFDVVVKAIPPKADLLFVDDFIASKLTGWTVVNDGTVQGPSNWVVANGVLKQTSNIHGEGANTIDKPGTFVVANSSTVTDYRLVVRLQSNSDGAIGVMFRYKDKDNYYRFSMHRKMAYRRLVRRAGGVTTVLWEDSTPHEKGRQYILAIDAFGNLLRGFLDGVPVFDVTDDDPLALTQGKIALYCWANVGSLFDSVRVSRSVPTEKVLLAEDFLGGMGTWKAVDEGTPSSPAAWKVVGGVLMHTAETHGGSLNPTTPDKPGTFVVRGDENWTDYRLSVRLRSDSEYAIGVMARYSDPNNYYRYSMDRRLGYRRLIKMANGKAHVLRQDNVRYQVGQDYQIEMHLSGSQIRVLLDGADIWSVNDSAPLSQGKIGLYCWGNASARFDDVKVRAKKWTVDTLLDEDFSAFNQRRWSVVELTSSSETPDWQLARGMLQHMNLHPGTAVVAGTRHWTNYHFSTRLRTDGYGTLGVTFGYQDTDDAFFLITDQCRSRLIRQSGSTIDVLWQGSETLTPEQWHTLTIELTPSRIKVNLDRTPWVELGIGGEGRVGLCAWGTDRAQFDNVMVTQKVLKEVALLSEDFSAGMGAWTIVDEGTPSPKAAWSVKSGVLVQTAEAHGGSLDPSKLSKPGTFVIAGDPKWMDYRLTVHLRSESEYGIGVIFRYTDTDNYYRFSMDRLLGYRRLIKKASGTVSVLCEDQVAYEVGRDYLVTVDAFGDLLQVYVDGVRLYSWVDKALSKGQIGLYCWGNAGARFDEVAVLAPQFVDYYCFEGESRLPAGTVIRIHAGSAPYKAKTGGGIESRYVAQLGEQGWPLLNPTGEVLRVIDQTGSEGHRRPFLPSNVYKPVPVVLLRTRDGTAAYLFFPDDGNAVGPLPDGHYRLMFTFQRDISKKDPKVPVLRRAGSSDPEKALIEFMVPSAQES